MGKAGWRRLGAVVCGVMALGLAGCAGAGRPAAVAAGPIPPGQARIWFYRVWEPSISLNVANVALNGTPAGSVPAHGGGLYRDVPPGHYRISAMSYRPEAGRASDVDLAPGQLVFAKVVAENDTSGDGDMNSFHRDDFSIRIMPEAVARAEMASGG